MQQSAAYALQQRGLKRNSTMTVHGWRTQGEVAAHTDMIFTVNSLMKDRVCKTYDLNAFPLPDDLDTALSLNMLWHRSRNTNPMLVWARQLFKQVVAEYTDQTSDAPTQQETTLLGEPCDIKVTFPVRRKEMPVGQQRHDQTATSTIGVVRGCLQDVLQDRLPS
ncbi:hypothetical protein ABIC76_003600 [Ralstonia sp. 1138]